MAAPTPVEAVPPTLSAPCATLTPVSYTAEQLHALVDRCEQFRDTKAPVGYRDGLALCVVDSVQSTGVTYSSVESVVARYRAYRQEQGGDPNSDGVPELLTTFDHLSGPDGWAQLIGNRNRTSTHAGASLKAAAIRQAALALTAEGIDTAVGLRGGDQGRRALGAFGSGVASRARSTLRDHVALRADARRDPGSQAGPDDLPLRRRRAE